MECGGGPMKCQDGGTSMKGPADGCFESFPNSAVVGSVRRRMSRSYIDDYE